MSQPKSKRKPGKPDVFTDAQNLYKHVLNITSNEKVFRPDLKVKDKDHMELREYVSDLIEFLDSSACKEDKITLAIEYFEQYRKEQTEFQRVENIYVSLIVDLRRSAKDIYLYAWKANKTIAEDKPSRELRNKYQLKALASCSEHLALISLAKRLCHLPSKKVTYWNKCTEDVQKQLNNWHKSERYNY